MIYERFRRQSLLRLGDNEGLNYEKIQNLLHDYENVDQLDKDKLKESPLLRAVSKFITMSEKLSVNQDGRKIIHEQEVSTIMGIGMIEGQDFQGLLIALDLIREFPEGTSQYEIIIPDPAHGRRGIYRLIDNLAMPN